MLSYLITEGSFSFNYSQVFENAHCIANTNEYILNPNEIIDISHGILLNTNYDLFLKIDPDLEESLDIIGKDHFEFKEKINIKLKNKSDNTIKISPYHPLIHIVSCNCSNYKFNLIPSQIESDVEKTINDLIDNVVKTELFDTEPVVESVVEPVAELDTEQVAETVAEPVVESVAEPVVESVAELDTEQVAEPVAEPVVESVAEPVAEPVAEQVAESVAEPVTESIVEPVINSIEELKVEESTTDSGTESKQDDFIKKRKYIRKKRV